MMNDKNPIAALAGEIAELAGERARAELLDEHPDTKRARELSGIFREMNAMRRELGASDSSVDVRFAPEAEKASV